MNVQYARGMLVLALVLLTAPHCWSKALYPPCDILGLSRMQPSVAAKGRVQDVTGTGNVLARGKQAIPELIACLTDQRTTKHPVFQYWSQTSVGDIAFVFLTDLFTDTSWQHITVEDVPSWQSIQAESPNRPAEQAWRNYITKHGRKHVQQMWENMWRKNESRIYWDDSEQCFKLRHDS